MIRKYMVAAALLLGCHNPQSYSDRTIYFQVGEDGEVTYASLEMTQEELAQLPVIATRMNHFLDCPNLIRFTAIDRPPTKEHLLLSQDAVWGIYNPKDREIAILIGGVEQCDHDYGQSFDSCFQTLVLHELGHSFGLQHLDVPSVMFSKIGSAWDFNNADKAERDRVFYTSITIKKEE